MTKAIAVGGSTFGPKLSNNYLIDDVVCQGGESNIRDCGYKTRNNCKAGKAAGVICIDPQRMKLVGASSAQRAGNVFIGGAPVCASQWDTNNARVVCNALFQSQFADREVPVFEVTQVFHPASKDFFIMDNVRCNGKEKQLTDCQFQTINQDRCNSRLVAGVKCAKCTPANLLSIIDSVEIGSFVGESRKSISAAFNKLKSQCYAWDCSVKSPAYPEYCQLLAFLQEARQIVATDHRKQALVSRRFRPGELLKHQFTREQSNNLLQRIDSLSEQSAAFQKQLADYYITLANFDREKSKADHDYETDLWWSQRKAVGEIQAKLGPELSKLFGFAFGAQTAHIVDATAQLALSIAALVSPVDAVLNPGEMAEKASAIADRAAELADSVAEMANLGYTFHKTLPKFAALAAELKKNFDDHRDAYVVIGKIVSIKSEEVLTPDQAKKFLEAYYNYSPAITANQLATYQVLIDQIVENACDVLTEPGGTNKAYIKLAATGLCPTIQQSVEILKDMLAELKDTQFAVMDAFADFARAKVSEMAARDLAKVVGRSSADVLEGRIAKKRAGVLYQMHKTTLINNACDYIRYMYYGVEQEFCKSLRGNTFGDISNLVAFNYDKDITCTDRYTRRGTFNIPAKMRNGDEELPPGTLDLTVLLDQSEKSGSTLFKIPDTQWLVDNGWIFEEEKDQGPFFIKQLQLYPLPAQTKKQQSVITEFSLVENIVGKEVYAFDEQVHSSFFIDVENNICNYPYRLVNPYSVRNCKPLRDFCMRSEGLFQGPIYPSLMSLWRVFFKIPLELKQDLPYPVNAIDLKVEAEICFRKSFAKRDVEEKEEKQSECCADSQMYEDKNGDCKRCPKNSSSRLNGYFCESCPAGFYSPSKEPSNYGCRPCPVNTFKDKAGNSDCLSCAIGKTTNGAKGSSFCVGPKSGG